MELLNDCWDLDLCLLIVYNSPAEKTSLDFHDVLTGLCWSGAFLFGGKA